MQQGFQFKKQKPMETNGSSIQLRSTRGLDLANLAEAWLRGDEVYGSAKT